MPPKKSSIHSLREKARQEYKAIGSVLCPYFGEEIRFAAEGFKHIRYPDDWRERTVRTQEIRYKLLGLAPAVLRKSGTLQEFEEMNVLVEEKMKKKRQKTMKKARFFAFIAIIDGRKIKVIVRQIEKGPKYFWSVIPNWKTRKSKENGQNFRNATGNLATD